MPACLPEQLLCAGVGASPASISARALAAWPGICGPHSNASRVRPRRSSHAATRVTCIGSPRCEAQLSAISSALRSKASAAPLSITVNACSGLIAERGKIGRVPSPQVSRAPPWRSTTAAATRCTLSTMPPRVTSTAIGVAGSSAITTRWVALSCSAITMPSQNTAIICLLPRACARS